ncbi:hypothetical protein ZOSMA_545G00080, partial [Zostera marina]
MPSNAPPLPPGPHPSLLGSNQQPHFQVTSHQQQQQAYPQQMMPLHPQNMPQIQPHMQHHPLHLRQRPPPQGSMPLPPSSLPQTPNLMIFVLKQPKEIYSFCIGGSSNNLLAAGCGSEVRICLVFFILVNIHHINNICIYIFYEFTSSKNNIFSYHFCSRSLNILFLYFYFQNF